MEFYEFKTEYCAGIDLHWDNMYTCIMDAKGKKHVHRRLRNSEKTFLNVIKPYAHSLTVVVESTGTWYWLRDLCDKAGVEFVLGHTIYMKWIHGAKAKNDRIDSEKIARITIGGNLPVAYAHPKKGRGTRDLLRRRGRIVALRTGVLSHIKTLNAQANLPPLGRATRKKETRDKIGALFDDADMAMSAEVDAVMADFFDSVVVQIEQNVLKRAKEYQTKDLAILMTTPGVGKILGLTIALEVHDIKRFSSRQHFCSYCRLINVPQMSNRKKVGSAGRKIGNPYLKWAFSEVAFHAVCADGRINALWQKIQKTHGADHSLSLIAHKFGRAIYYMLLRGTAFNIEKFLKG